MKGMVNVVLFVAGVSLLTGIISRITLFPVPIANTGIEAEAFLNFANTCLLIAAVLLLQQLVKSR
ncbi:MAG: hypothetical protein PHG31_05160 [Candidatus Omnitrophica bacterium]|nr:hypothetical protein [Candidatus Omnitrophota bacterium]